MKVYQFYGIILVTLVFMLAGCSCGEAAEEVATPEGEISPLLFFADQEPPGVEPQPLGSSWFQGGFHSAPVFAPDGKTVWWAGSYATQTVYVSRLENGRWTEQEKVSFSKNIQSYRDPFISPDGLRFYFISTAPVPGHNDTGKENLWMMEWISDGWTEPQPLPEVVNNYQLHWTPSVASNYDLYFSANIDGNPELFKSAYQNGSYTEPIPLVYPINTEGLEFTPNIAPDQSYLLFSRAKDNKEPAHLYIAYAQGDGWTEPIRVENVQSCISPIVTPDRRYVIYLTGPAALEWRDTSFVEELRPN